MIIIFSSQSISHPEHDMLLYEFERIKKSAYVKKSHIDIDIIYQIIENIPLPHILEEFIFSNRKYNLIIKHDALIRAIELGYGNIVERVLLHSTNVELIKTAITSAEDDKLLQIFATRINTRIHKNNQRMLQELALNNIKDFSVFSEAFRQISSDKIIVDLFKKIKYKSQYGSLSTLQKRILPILLSYIPQNEATIELNRKKKYPVQIRKSILVYLQRNTSSTNSFGTKANIN